MAKIFKIYVAHNEPTDKIVDMICSPELLKGSYIHDIIKNSKGVLKLKKAKLVIEDWED